MGVLIINRAHSDFPALLMLTKVLGGYIGSRLMSNIRQDKGCTYGINSNVASYSQAIVLSISTEVGNEVVGEAFLEVIKEINLLRTSLVPDDEMNL